MRVEILTKDDLETLMTMHEALRDEVRELKNRVNSEYMTSAEAQKYVGKTKQKFYDFVAYYDVRTTGRGRSIKYRMSDLDMGLRLEGKKCG